MTSDAEQIPALQDSRATPTLTTWAEMSRETMGRRCSTVPTQRAATAGADVKGSPRVYWGELLLAWALSSASLRSKVSAADPLNCIAS